MGRLHTLASPSARAWVGLNPRRTRRRQCKGTGTKTEPDGGAGQSWAIQWPKARPFSGKAPYFIRCTTASVPRATHSRKPKPHALDPQRKAARAWEACPEGSNGQAHRHGGQIPATSFNVNAAPHCQHMPKPIMLLQSGGSRVIFHTIRQNNGRSHRGTQTMHPRMGSVHGRNGRS